MLVTTSVSKEQLADFLKTEMWGGCPFWYWQYAARRETYVLTQCSVVKSRHML